MNEEKINTLEKISFILKLIVGSMVALIISFSLESIIEQSKNMHFFNTLNVPTIIGIFIILTTIYLEVMNIKE